MQKPSFTTDESNRREFLAAGAVGASSLQIPGAAADVAKPDWLDRPRPIEEFRTGSSNESWRPYKVDLAPARWIWLPSGRCLPNTFVLFRKEFTLVAKPSSAVAWITADSRYRLTVNGVRVQWGPAPCDPRQLDVDPAEVLPHLRPGRNVIGVQVLYYGHGDGAWAGGMPGLIFHASLDTPDGAPQAILTDKSWMCRVDRAHRPGAYKRWYLRSLQEEFDARKHPHGWDTAEFQTDTSWMPAEVLKCASDKPACSAVRHYWAGDSIDHVDPAKAALRLRQIPLVKEQLVTAVGLAASGRVKWLRDPDDWFDLRVPNSFEIARQPVARQPVARGDVQSGWEMPAVTGQREGLYATFEFKDQIVGWPYFSIDAPEGTVVELITQESHDPAKVAWLDSYKFTWSRFTCREGLNRLEAFDFESCRWIQLHIRNAARPVRIAEVGMRRREFDWPNEPAIRCSEAALQRLFDAGVNTLRNSSIETIVDGMGRERQQYSGDGGLQIHAIRYAFGETRIVRRFLRTFSEGMTLDGYFLDCWPAYDRLARIAQRELDATPWGPLLDHGVGFNFDCWNHYLETGEREALVEPYPRLVRFAAYLETLRRPDGLLPAENIGIPWVWMDWFAYQQARHKRCAFNLYVAAMYRHAIAPMADLFGEPARARRYRQLGDGILAAAVRQYWSPERRLFVNNLPWLKEEKSIRLCDRSLANAILFDQCPGNDVAASAHALASAPRELGISYPGNAGWRYWALMKTGHVDAVLKDFRQRWATMASVKLNNTLQEFWQVPADSEAQWSHCPLSPIYILFMDIAGIRPLAPGFTRCQIRPQLGDLPDLELAAHTPQGAIHFAAQAESGGHRIELTLPAGCEGEILAPRGSTVPLRALADHPTGLKRYLLPAKQTAIFHVVRSTA